ncbi:hypothetical protein [Jatrophihabitans sp.]|uniref:hypothetical protein n=1 Tax=Jatrophihabitans sp. TaxID=1932789 RepID=UPI0030C6E3AB|nr:hypothetical protein [Jatrophihabitans sp.]
MKTSRIALVCTAALAATCLAAVALPERRAAATPLPPAAITDLSAAQTTSTSITLTWTAPGSSGNSGTASSYDIRYASALITPTTWSSASSASGAPSPHVAGTTETYTMTVTAGQRYWFAIETSNGTSVSGLSNTVANPPANLNQVDVFTMADDVLNARTRQLVETLHPDMVERASFEFMATQEMARAYTNIPDRLQLAGQGALLGAGVDHDAFAVGGATNYSSGTSVESRASGTTYSDLASSAAPYGFATDEAFNMNYGSTSAIKQLEYKAELQMNAGYNIIEFDQDAMNSSEMATVYTDLHSYAAAHGETVYLTGNGDTLPGADAYDSTPHFTHADFALRQYPRNWEPSGTWSAYGGSSTLAPNYISFYRAMVVRDAGSTPTMPSFGFVDTPASSDGSPTWPANSANWPAFLRINEAQLLASGILPGYTSIYTDAFDTQQNNLFANELNESKFIRENDQLFHNLTLISPSTLTSSAAGVYLSAFSQTGRTIVHAVNGNYSYSANTMTPVSNDTVSVSLTAAPTRIWVTTPDVLSGSRRTVLPTSDWSYSSGTATITLPSLDYHDVIVIEQSSGAAYNPVYSPMQIVMPWNTQSELMAGNHLQLTALQTEGHSTALNWSVNNIAGGSATYGTVDSSGMYTAPLVPPSPATVTITATSPELSSASASVT